jgi:hypothetical protein
MSDESTNELRIDRTAFSIVPLSEAGNDVAFWLSRTAEERRQGIETSRRVLYGEEATSGRLQRILEIVKRAPG